MTSRRIPIQMHRMQALKAGVRSQSVLRLTAPCSSSLRNRSCQRLIHHPSGQSNGLVCSPYPSTTIIKRWISSNKLTVEHQTDTTAFDSRPAKEDLVFGQTPSDHMLLIEYEHHEGDGWKWGSPKIIPYQDLSISPAASCLHYGQ